MIGYTPLQGTRSHRKLRLPIIAANPCLKSFHTSAFHVADTHFSSYSFVCHVASQQEVILLRLFSVHYCPSFRLLTHFLILAVILIFFSDFLPCFLSLPVPVFLRLFPTSLNFIFTVLPFIFFLSFIIISCCVLFYFQYY
jgi:hypothetical protein